MAQGAGQGPEACSSPGASGEAPVLPRLLWGGTGGGGWEPHAHRHSSQATVLGLCGHPVDPGLHRGHSTSRYSSRGPDAPRPAVGLTSQHPLHMAALPDTPARPRPAPSPPHCPRESLGGPQEANGSPKGRARSSIYRVETEAWYWPGKRQHPDRGAPCSTHGVSTPTSMCRRPTSGSTVRARRGRRLCAAIRQAGALGGGAPPTCLTVIHNSSY